jgi:hypothetical protein
VVAENEHVLLAAEVPPQRHVTNGGGVWNRVSVSTCDAAAGNRLLFACRSFRVGSVVIYIPSLFYFKRRANTSCLLPRHSITHIHTPALFFSSWYVPSRWCCRILYLRCSREI